MASCVVEANLKFSFFSTSQTLCFDQLVLLFLLPYKPCRQVGRLCLAFWRESMRAAILTIDARHIFIVINPCLARALIQRLVALRALAKSRCTPAGVE